LLDDMFVLPLTLAGYHRPVHLPSPFLAVLTVGTLAALATALFWLAGRRPWALAAGVLALPLLWIASSAERIDPSGILIDGPAVLAGLQPAAIGWAGLLTIAPPLLRGELPSGPGRLAWLPLLFVHVFLAFQGFPRAGPDLFLAQADQLLLLVAVLATWQRAIAEAWAGSSARVARVASAVLLFALPVWLAASPAWTLLRAVAARETFRPLRLPRLEGVSLPASEIRRIHIDDLEQLVARLAAEPDGGPILLLTNEEIVHFSSGRPPLLPEHRAFLFWIGWGLGSRRGVEALASEVLAQLEATPGAPVIDAPGEPATRRLLETLPGLRGYLAAHYREAEHVGRYRILVRRDPVPSGGAPRGDRATLGADPTR
jgi:hypothetical protein